MSFITSDSFHVEAAKSRVSWSISWQQYSCSKVPFQSPLEAAQDRFLRAKNGFTIGATCNERLLLRTLRILRAAADRCGESETAKRIDLTENQINSLKRTIAAMDKII